jgi:D-arabinose 5-phosphate isomerase GutQ
MRRKTSTAEEDLDHARRARCRSGGAARTRSDSTPACARRRAGRQLPRQDRVIGMGKSGHICRKIA